MTTLPFLLLVLFSFVIFNSDCVLISCLLCKSNTLWNIFIILVRNVEQDKMRCVQKWQLWLSYFWSFLPLFCFWNGFRVCNLNTLQSILVVLGRNVEQDVSHTRMISLLSYFWLYLPLLYLTVIMHWLWVHSVSLIPFGIFLWYLVEM